MFASRRTPTLTHVVAFLLNSSASRLGVCLLLGVAAVGLSTGPVSAQQSGASLVKDINSGTCERPRLGSSQNGPCQSRPREFTVYDGTLYFSASDGETGRELWRYDGSSTSLVKDINTELSPFAGMDDKPSSDPEGLTVYQGALYFAATKYPSDEKKIGGTELWTHDGSATQLVKDLNPGKGKRGVLHSSSPRMFIVYKDELHFVTGGGTLRSYDGSTIKRVKDLEPEGEKDWQIENLTAYDGGLYFSTVASDKFGTITDPYKVWKYEGSSIRLVKTFSQTGLLSEFTVYGGKLYFRANDGETGVELWSYDGSSVRQVKDLNSGSDGSDPKALTVYDGALYFVAKGGEEKGLWKYDGSKVSLVTDDVEVDVNTAFTAVCEGVLYFPADDGASGTELYRYDGSTVRQAAEINPGEEGSGLRSSAVTYDGALYFAADDGESGRELWRYRPE